MGSVKTEFGKMLKELSNEDDENKKLIQNAAKMLLKNLLIEINNNNIRKKIFEQLLENRMSDLLNKKNLWLNVKYETTNSIKPLSINLSITPKLSKLKVIFDNNGKKIPKMRLHYSLSSNPNKTFIGEALLRWGNGIGIANIRWNIS